MTPLLSSPFCSDWEARPAGAKALSTNMVNESTSHVLQLMLAHFGSVSGLARHYTCVRTLVLK